MESPAFRVAHMAHVAKQMRDLTKRAAALGNKPQLLAALESLDKQLHSAPLVLGNPVHNTNR